jgi:Tol biopolymer transport system component
MGFEVKNMRALLVAASVLVVVAGCGRAPEGPPTGDYKLYEAASTQSSQLVSVIDSRSHSVERSLPLGTVSPDWSHLYTVNSSHALQDIDPKSGTTLQTLPLPADFQLPPATMSGLPGGLSPNGKWLVLERFDEAATSTPTGSHMLIVDTTYASKPVAVDLTGWFEFDAISNDGKRLYVIEYANSVEQTYRVRVYEVDAGRLGDYTVVDKGGSTEPMNGIRLSSVASPDGQWLYSVYARKDSGAFVHALNLTQPYAFCLDLTGSGWSTSADVFKWSLALSADGRHLYAANGTMGVVTLIENLDGYNPSIVRTAHIGVTSSPASLLTQDVQAKELGPNGAVLSQDGSTLVMVGGSGVEWIDTSTMKLVRNRLPSWRVWSISASPDGKVVYAVSDASQIAELWMMDGRVAATFNGAPGQPMSLMRVEPV